MGLLNVIRKLRLRQGLPIREIERRTGLSRNTIKKYLKDDTIEPKFTTPDRPSKLDPFAEKLAGWLKTEAGKSRKERRTHMSLWLETSGPTSDWAPKYQAVFRTVVHMDSGRNSAEISAYAAACAKMIE